MPIPCRFPVHSLPRPYLGPDRPPSANWWACGPASAPGPLFFFTSGFVPSLPLALGSPSCIMCQPFSSQARLCWSTQLTTRTLPHRNALVSFAVRSSEPFLPMSHHLLPQVVRLPRPLLPAGRIFPMYSRQIPLAGGHHVRSVSCPALPCPATSCPAGCPVACLLGRSAGRPAGLHHR